MRGEAAAIPEAPSTLGATLIGGAAVLMWATLALLTILAGPIPPFQLVAMAFGVSFLLAMAKWRLMGQRPGAFLRQPLPVWIVGVGGLFGFHLLYFVALQRAPPVEANLINYSWPLLIVLLSALAPGERLRWWHLAGATMGLAGTVMIVAQGDVAFGTEHAGGYVAALGSALVWAVYSVLNRRFGAVPTDIVGAFCGATALLSFAAHLAVEPTVWPTGATAWLAVLLLGMGPVGCAFFFWDYATKHGDIRALGAIAYAAPLLSTLILVAAGSGTLTPRIVAAAGLIVGGAALASRELFRRTS